MIRVYHTSSKNAQEHNYNCELVESPQGVSGNVRNAFLNFPFGKPRGTRLNFRRTQVFWHGHCSSHERMQTCCVEGLGWVVYKNIWNWKKVVSWLSYNLARVLESHLSNGEIKGNGRKMCAGKRETNTSPKVEYFAVLFWSGNERKSRKMGSSSMERIFFSKKKTSRDE